MDSILFKIQDTVIKYANIMSKISKVDVEVIDHNFFRVAGTGIFKNKINMDMSQESHAYKYVILTGKLKIIVEPGKDELCKYCPNVKKCLEIFSISMPIILNDITIGVIRMMSCDLKQKDLFLSNLQTYIELIEQISDFISTKAFEYIKTNEIIETLDAVDAVIENIEQGVLIIGKNNVLTSINKSAKYQLDVSEDILNTEVSIYSTGDIIEDQSEFHINIDNKNFTVIGKITLLTNNNSKYHIILIFSNISKLRDKINKSSTIVYPLAIESIIGNSDATRNLKEKILKIAKSQSTVLIMGESGTGKEMVATAIWKASNRSKENFVTINCGAIPEQLFESELFGYVKGAFTGADAKGKIGKFELANNGIIFLDEIGDMPQYLQIKLLRVLQEKKIVRIGSNHAISLNIRVIAATNKDLINMVKEKKFREDLYYRLNVIPLYIEPLRKRKEEVTPLVNILIQRYSQLNNKEFHSMTDDTMQCLLEYEWPGNVRELENAIEFMINMMDDDGVLSMKTLPSVVDKNISSKVPTYEYSANKILSFDEIEKKEIKKMLERHGESTENKKKIAYFLGIGIATLYRKIKKYNL